MLCRRCNEDRLVEFRVRALDGGGCAMDVCYVCALQALTINGLYVEQIGGTLENPDRKIIVTSVSRA